MINEMLKMTGHLKISLNDELVQDIPNKVVHVGKNWVADRMGASSQPNAMSRMAVGTGTTGAADGDAELGAQKGSRVTFEGGYPKIKNPSAATSSDDRRTVQFKAVFPAGNNTGALTEAGIFNAAATEAQASAGGTVGTMLCRTTFDVVNKGAADSLTIEWEVKVS